MLAKYTRFRALNDCGQSLAYASGSRLSLRFTPKKFTAGALDYETVITDDFGFGGTDTIADGADIDGASAPIETSVVDNTTNLNIEGDGYFEVTGITSAAGTIYLYMETSDDNTNWPSDATDFDVEEDATLICAIPIVGAEVKGQNFQVS